MRKRRVIAFCLCVFLIFFLCNNTVAAFNHRSKPKKVLKILVIGNSFGKNAIKYLPPIFNAYSDIKVKIGFLHIGASSIRKHWKKAKDNVPSYTYFTYEKSSWKRRENKTMLYGLRDQKWDIITLQEKSKLAGIEKNYDKHLPKLVNYINKNKWNKKGKLAWHMTWAFQSNCRRGDFARYNYDQKTMYTAITNTVSNKILPMNEFHLVIPAGTAIQNVRTSFIGDTLTRDGVHLKANTGKYIAGLTWFKTFTGLPIDKIDFVPSNIDVQKKQLPAIIEAVNAAVKKPFKVTESSFTSPAPQTPRPKFVFYKPVLSRVNTSSTQVAGRFEVENANVKLFKRKKEIGHATVENGKFSFSIKSQRPGTRFQALAYNTYIHTLSSKTIVTLETPKVIGISSQSLTGAAYPKSTITVYNKDKVIGTSKTNSDGYFTIDLNKHIHNNQSLIVFSTYRGYTSMTEIKV